MKGKPKNSRSHGAETVAKPWAHATGTLRRPPVGWRRQEPKDAGEGHPREQKGALGGNPREANPRAHGMETFANPIANATGTLGSLPMGWEPMETQESESRAGELDGGKERMFVFVDVR